DVYNRLIGKQVDTNGDGTYDSAQRFAYDASISPLPLGEGQGEGGASPSIALVFNASSNLTDRVLNGPDASQPLADENSTNVVSWLVTDNQGTIRDVAQYNSGTDTTSIVDHLKYDSFGNITNQSNSANQPLFGFTGQLFDKDTGLQYNLARWYDPKVGRFISQDPSGFAAGDPNLYRYVTNSPPNFVDPTGLAGQPAASGGAMYSGGGFSAS